MRAIKQDFYQATERLSEEVVRPIPGSQKVYVEGSRKDIQVPMREVSQSDTEASFGFENNPPITVYDTSGPYTDPKADIDLTAGLPSVRDPWISEREDTEQLSGPSSEFGLERQNDKSLDHLRFEHLRNPRKAKPGKNV